MVLSSLGNKRVSGKGTETAKVEKGIARGVLQPGANTQCCLIHAFYFFVNS